jgi:hypothetical protein
MCLVGYVCGTGNVIRPRRDSSTGSRAGALNVKMALPGMIGFDDEQALGYVQAKSYGGSEESGTNVD